MKIIKVMAAMEVEVSDKMYEMLKAGNHPTNNYFIILGDEEDRPGLWIQINNKSANLGNIYNQDVVDIKLP